jgi:hypothetical protein
MSDPASKAAGIDPKAQAGFAPANGSLRALVVKWRQEAETCNRGAGAAGTKALVVARVAVGGTYTACADELERLIAENDQADSPAERTK